MCSFYSSVTVLLEAFKIKIIFDDHVLRKSYLRNEKRLFIKVKDLFDSTRGGSWRQLLKHLPHA